jgi:hypothetical protein
LTLGLTTSHGNNKESPMIVIITLTYKNMKNPLAGKPPGTGRESFIRFLMAFLADLADSYSVTEE